MVAWGGSAVSVRVFLSTRGQRRPATGAPPRARPLKSPPKEHLSPFQIKRPAAKRSAPPYAHGARGGRSPNEEGSPAPPLCLGIGNAFFLPPRPPFFSFLGKNPTKKREETTQPDGAQEARRGTGSATTSSEAGTFGVKARNDPGAPRGSRRQGVCTHRTGRPCTATDQPPSPARREEGREAKQRTE